MSLLIDNLIHQQKSNKELLEQCSIENQHHLGKLLKKIYKPTKIRLLLLCNWCDSKNLCDFWNKMSKGDYTWNNICVVSEEPADYYCIINKPSDDYEIDKSKTILFRMEPYMEKHQEKWGTEWFNPNKDEFILCVLSK